MRGMKSVLLALACAGCSAEPDITGNAREASTSAAADLTGTWSVAEIDGNTRLKFPIEIEGDHKRLWWEPTCAGQNIDYRSAADGRTDFFNPDTDELRIVCDIGFQQDLPRVWQSMRGLRNVKISEAGVATITGDGHRIVLEPISRDDLTTLVGEWRVAGIDGRSLNEPSGLALRADDNEIWWEPRCLGAIIGYSISGDRFHVVGPSPTAEPLPLRADVPSPPPVCAVNPPPRLSDAMDAIRAGEKIERTRSNAIHISGGGRSVTLFSQ